jgi:hypothetical protein
MLIVIGNVLAGLVGAGIIYVGTREIWAPHESAGFGIPNSPVEDPTFQAWLKVKAARDIASGVFLFLLMLAGTPHLLGWFVLAAAGIPIGDMLIVLNSKGPKSAAYGIHGATALVMLIAALLLLIS